MNAAEPYQNRRDAGRFLGAEVRRELGTVDGVVLGLPRGGVPVGFEVARALGAPLDVIIVRKLGVPVHPELAMGAIASGYEVLNEPLVAELGISSRALAAVATRERAELERREARYRGERPPIDCRGRTVVLVDDGLATGFTMRAAIGAVKARDAKRLVVAVPVGAADTCAELAGDVDVLICPLQPEPFHAVGLWYRDFAPTTDEEVIECLPDAAASPSAGRGPTKPEPA